MKFAIRQRFTLDFPAGTNRPIEHLLLTPSSGPSQTVIDWTIAMDGIEQAARFVDGYGNQCHLVTQHKPEEPLIIEVAGTVETIDRNGVLGRVPGDPVNALYRRITPLTKPDKALYEGLDTANGRTVAVLHGLMARVRGESAVVKTAPVPVSGQRQSQDGQSQRQGFTTPEVEPEAEPASEAGQDGEIVAGFETNFIDNAVEMTHRLIGAARALGIPARYVTGYVHDIEEGASGFHAWAEGFVEGLGWIAFDCALGYCPTDKHVRLAVALDAASTVPVRSVPTLGDAVVETEITVELLR